MKIFLVAALLLAGCKRPAAEPSPGFVLLLRQPLALTPAQIAEKLAQEFKRPFPLLDPQHAGPDPPDFLAAHSTHLEISIARDVVRLTAKTQPYVEDLPRWPFIAPHQAWLALDHVSPVTNANSWRHLARLLAALTPRDPVALYLSTQDRMIPAPPDLTTRLRQPDPVQALFP